MDLEFEAGVGVAESRKVHALDSRVIQYRLLNGQVMFFLGGT